MSLSLVFSQPDVYITTHQHDSSQPQQSHDSPQVGLMGFGLMMEEMEDVVLPFMVAVWRSCVCGC
jgi:hypothetical protein